MNEKHTTHVEGQDRPHVVYLVQEPCKSVNQDDVNVLELMRVIWASRVWIFLFAVAVTVGAAAYVFIAPEWFKAQASLIPRDNASGSRLSSQLSQLGGLASMAGLNLSANSSQEPLAVLKSWGFAQRFIVNNDLAGALSVSHSWRTSRVDQSADVTKIVDEFRRSVFKVTDDKKTGLVNVSIEWTDPVIAADWANKIAVQINNEMRDKAIGESTRNMAYLRAQLQAANEISLKQSISSLLQTEMQKQMLAQGTDEYAFRVIDHAQPPALRVRPKRALTILTAFFISLLGGATVPLFFAQTAKKVASSRP
jgi:uncharacterized protein involved in exopolysaccharide biosynthesis